MFTSYNAQSYDIGKFHCTAHTFFLSKGPTVISSLRSLCSKPQFTEQFVDTDSFHTHLT